MKVSKMADMFIVDVDAVPVYTSYFDITLIPATIFFFNGQHIKVDWRYNFSLFLKCIILCASCIYQHSRPYKVYWELQKFSGFH